MRLGRFILCVTMGFAMTFVLATTGARAVSWASAEAGANAPLLLIDT